MVRSSTFCRTKFLLFLIVVLSIFAALINQIKFTFKKSASVKIWDSFPFYDKYLLQKEKDGNQSYRPLKYDFRLVQGNRSIDDSRVNVRQNTCKGCFPHDYNMVLDNREICATNYGEFITVILMIPSAPERKQQRETIRNTWLTYSENNTAQVRYAFLMGTSNNESLNEEVQVEHSMYEDILQEDFLDSYRNLTVKTVMALKWASETCENATFLMKIDDDVYLNIPGLLSILEGQIGKRLKFAVGGACQKTSSPSRHADSKFFVSKEMYPKNIYPEYCAGPGYVMGMNVARNIYPISRNVPYFPFEDVYIAFCVKILGFRLVNIDGFHGTLPTFDACSFKHLDFVMAHSVPTHLMQQIWSAECKNIGTVAN